MPAMIRCIAELGAQYSFKRAVFPCNVSAPTTVTDRAVIRMKGEIHTRASDAYSSLQRCGQTRWPVRQFWFALTTGQQPQNHFDFFACFNFAILIARTFFMILRRVALSAALSVVLAICPGRRYY